MELRTVRASGRVVLSAGHAVRRLRIDARTDRSIFLSDMSVSTRRVVGMDDRQRAPWVCRGFHMAVHASNHVRVAHRVSVLFSTSPAPQEKCTASHRPGERLVVDRMQIVSSDSAHLTTAGGGCATCCAAALTGSRAARGRRQWTPRRRPRSPDSRPRAQRRAVVRRS